MTKAPRGTTQRRGSETEFKVVITYREFAEKVVSGFGVVDENTTDIKTQIDNTLTIMHLKIKEMADISGLSYDLCRRFKQIAERYSPVDEGVLNDR